jgi:hypothetical protein
VDNYGFNHIRPIRSLAIFKSDYQLSTSQNADAQRAVNLAENRAQVRHRSFDWLLPCDSLVLWNV